MQIGNVSNRQVIDHFTMSVVSIAFLFVFPLVGLLVAYIGFCDPDTCWHLALGKWIFTNHGLPHIDPFSSNIFHYVFVADNLPLMQHEWLSDLAFYCIFAAFGSIGLLVFTALASICSFVIIPSLLMLRRYVPRIIVLVLITLAIFASSFRLWVRPEVFSFLLMSALIIVNDICQTTKNWKRAAVCSTIVFAIMSLWVNFHGLFIVGLAYLTGYCLIIILESLWLKNTTTPVARAITTLVVAFLGTLNTPWHFEFWKYIFKIGGSSITYSNRGNGPMTINDLTHPTFIPLCLLLILVWSLLLWCAFKKKELLKTQLLPLGLSLCATAVIIGYHRMTPLAILVLFAAVSKAFQIMTVDNKQIVDSNGLLKTSENYFADRHMPDGWQNMLIGITTCGLTCFLVVNYLVPPHIPSASQLFHPPYAAIQYLEQHPQKGRLFNDSKLGSMMTWNMINPPDIFIDGQFCNFDPQLVYDYNKMRLCKNNWQQLLDQYKIAWLFFPPQTPIVEQLSKIANWNIEYADKEAVVLHRKMP